MNTMRTTMLAALGLVVSLTGCNIVLSLDDFSQAEPKAGSGGAGGLASSSSGAGGLASSSSGAGGLAASSSGAGGQTSSSSGAGGAGGQAPTCDGARACVGAVPEGWTGPMALYLGGSGASAPGCVGDYGVEGNNYVGDLAADESSCTCSCDPGVGMSCASSTTVCSKSDCAPAGGCTSTLTVNENCVSNTFGPSVRVSEPSITDVGSCKPSPTETIVAASWGVKAKACGTVLTTALGCIEGQLCAPVVTAPSQQLCVLHSGEVACTDAYYTEQHILYDGADDSRKCTSCSCGTPTVNCNGELHFSSVCNGGFLGGSIKAGACAAVPNTDSSRVAFYVKPSGTCTPVGGDLTGALAPKGAVTFCCQPVAVP